MSKDDARHFHHDFIIAWAKGSAIQHKIYGVKGSTWIDVKTPTWDENVEYRLKPVYKSQEVIITLLYHNWYIEPVDEGKGNCLITYNAIDEQIIDISRVK